MDGNSSYEQIERKCAEIIAAKLGIEGGYVRPEDRLGEDLGLDSIGTVDVLIEIEDHFPANVPNDAPELAIQAADILQLRVKDVAMIVHRYQAE